MTNKSRHLQQGATAIEFPFVVVGIMTIVFGLVSVYQAMYTQTRLDSVSYMLNDVIARSFEDKASTLPSDPNVDTDSLSWLMKQIDRKDVATLAQRALPSGFSAEQIGIEVQILRERPSDGQSENETLQAGGYRCTNTRSINQLVDFAPESNLPLQSLNGRRATLIQVSVCVTEPFKSNAFLSWTNMVLPSELSSRSMLLGRRYER